MLATLLTIVGALVTFYIYDAIRKYNYWKYKGIPTPMPYPLVGRFVDMAMTGQGAFDQKWTERLGKTFGYFDGPVPVVVTSDTEMLKRVLIKDFGNFANHRIIDINDEAMEQNVFDLKDQRWKEVRSVLIPSFTAGRLRQMDYLINECCRTMVANFETIADKEESFEAKHIYGGLVLDIIASTFFGIKIDSQNDPDSTFVKHAYKAFKFSFANPLLIIGFLWPKITPYAKKLFRKFGLYALPHDSYQFFGQSIKDILQMRVESRQTRNDFLQLIMSSWKENPHLSQHTKNATDENFKDEMPDGADVVSAALIADGTVDKNSTGNNIQLTTEEVVAQCLIFFLAGYDTTATTMSFLSYNLALNPDIQDRLRKDIEEVMGDRSDPTYDLVARMEYLDMCVSETLRLYPVATRTEREAAADWEYDGVVYEKGTTIGIPIFAIHRDPRNWENPDVFNPERFSKENKSKIKPFTFMTFGQGPRICLGMRFAFLEIKMAMVHLLRNYRVVVTAKTEVWYDENMPP